MTAASTTDLSRAVVSRAPQPSSRARGSVKRCCADIGTAIGFARGDRMSDGAGGDRSRASQRTALKGARCAAHRMRAPLILAGRRRRRPGFEPAGRPGATRTGLESPETPKPNRAEVGRAPRNKRASSVCGLSVSCGTPVRPGPPLTRNGCAVPTSPDGRGEEPRSSGKVSPSGEGQFRKTGLNPRKNAGSFDSRLSSFPESAARPQSSVGTVPVTFCWRPFAEVVCWNLSFLSGKT